VGVAPLSPWRIVKRIDQIILIGTFLGFCWLGMQAVHELGHVLGAWTTGGKVVQVVLHPFTISRTDMAHNPHPLIEVWAGPLMGSLLPLFVFLLAAFFRCPGTYLIRFFAGFCLIANGVYIGAAWLMEGGADASVMVMLGCPHWILILFGFVTVPLGLYLWHRQGRHFGFGSAEGRVSRAAMIVSVCLFAGVFVLELLLGTRG